MSDSITRFVVLFHGRSGSTHLVTMLNGHPEIMAYGEIIADDGLRAQLRKTRRLFALEKDPIPDEVRAIGFKVKFGDVRNFDQFGELVREYDSKVVMLRRRNVVKKIVSVLNGKRLFQSTGKWNLDDEKDRLGRLVVDPEWFDERIQEIANATTTDERIVESLGQPYIRLFYEDLLIARDETLCKVFDFIGVSYRKLEERTYKNTSDDLSTVIENFDELRSRYVGTEYETMFDEVLVPDTSQ